MGGAFERVRARLRLGAGDAPRGPLNDGSIQPSALAGCTPRDRPLVIESVLNLSIASVTDGLRLRSRKPDPQLLLALEPTPDHATGPGLFWVRIAQGLESLDTPVVYLDHGAGFTGESERPLELVAPGLLAASVDECAGLVRLRFDPSLSDCDAVAAAVGFTEFGDGAGALGSPTLDGVCVLAANHLELAAEAGVLNIVDDHASFELRLAPWIRHGDLLVLELDASFEPAPQRLTIEIKREDVLEHHVVQARGTGERWSAVLFLPGEISRVRIKPGVVGTAVVRTVIARESTPADIQSWFGAPEFGEAIARSSGRLDPPDRRTFLAATAELAMSGDGDGAILLAMADELHSRRRNRDWSLLTEAERAGAADRGRALPLRPLISVLMPVYNPPTALLRAAVESVLAQVYDRWELCIADDASSDPEVGAALDALANADPRIKLVRRERNGHISAASNSALELVEGEWVALLDHDDLLTPDALLAVAETINDHPDVQMIYSDEDKLDEAGERRDPFRKPQFSPALFRSQNYLNHLTAHRTANVRAVGGWREGYEGGQDHDLNLRVLERVDARAVRHIPRILYHWRITPGSTAISAGEKGYAFLAGLRALEDHLERTGVDAHVEKQPGYPYYRVRYEPPTPAPLVSLLIPTRDKADVLDLAVSSILEKTEYAPFEIVIIDNGSVEPETAALFERLASDERVRIVPYDAPFNYSAINNFGARHARGEILGLVNNDVEVINSDWLTEMVSWAAQADVGCVGAKLYYADDTIQHAGVVLGIGGVAGHGHKRFPRDHPGYFSRVVLAHDVSAVTGACLLVRRSVFEAAGGLDEINLAVAFNDVDFCLKVREAGYRNIFTPYAELYHHESVSRGAEDTPEKQARFSGEVRYMLKRWGPQLRVDPFYSPHLTLTHEDFSARPLELPA